MTDLKPQRPQAALLDTSRGSFAKYRQMVVGDTGLGGFLKYEFITSQCGGTPGAAGLWLRQKLFRGLFRECGRNVVFGRHVVLRHPRRISIGSNVIISDGCVLDAKGAAGEGIIVRDGVFVGHGSIVSMTDGTIVLDEGCNIGSYCRIGTMGKSRIGKKVLLGAFCYVVGAYHETERTDIPILDQPSRTKGGAEVDDGCWLGARVTVLDGVKVGRDSIVGAHAVVTENLPEFCVAVGAPAKVIRMRK